MLGNLYLKSIDRIQNPEDDKVYLMLNGSIDRIDGGKYIENSPILLDRISGAVAVRGGHFNLTREINGIKYKGLEEYHIPLDEINKLRITKDDMPRIMIFHNGMVARVIDFQIAWNARTVRLWVEKTKDPYPNTYSVWTFEDNQVGEYPTGWGYNDPTSSRTIGIYGNPYSLGKSVQIYNTVLEPEEEYGPFMVLAASDFITGPFVRIKWRALWMSIVDDGGFCGFDWLGIAPNLFIGFDYLSWFGVYSPMNSLGGVYHLYGENTVLMYINEWYAFDLTLDRANNKLIYTITRESTEEKIVDIEDEYTDYLESEMHPLDLPCAYYLGFDGSPIGGLSGLGKAGIRRIDDVEVSSIA